LSENLKKYKSDCEKFKEEKEEFKVQNDFLKDEVVKYKDKSENLSEVV
jgi:hypothetical protein